jgi:hypothetical protein
VTDPGFVLAGYVVVVGGLTAYAVALRRRIATARRRAAAVAEETPYRGEPTTSSAPIGARETER